MSPVTHESVLFDVDDFKVFPLTSDTGGSPIFGAAVDVPGIAEVSLDPNLVTAELKGDGGKVLAKRGKIDRFNFSATYGKLDLDVLEVILAFQVDDLGTTPEQHARGRFKAGQQLPDFMAAFQILDVETGLEGLNVAAFKCQVTGGTLLGQSTDSFGQPTVDFEAVGLNCTDEPWAGLMLDLDFDETAVALADIIARVTDEP